MKKPFWLIVLLFVACGQQESVQTEAAPEPERLYLDAARHAAAWIESAAVETPHGIAWPADALRPEEIRTGVGDGVAGTMLFFLELHRATQEPQYLDAARRGADYLLTTLPDSVATDTPPRSNSLYGDVPGAGFALNELYKATGDTLYRDAALRCVEQVHQAAQPAGDGVVWSESFNDVLFGNAGTGLFLLYAAREMDHAASLDLAVQVGQMLIERARPEHDGLTWRFREEREFILPNFSHGAAGIGYFLASLYQETGHQPFLDAAQAAATYLQTIARTEDGGFLVPYGWPNPEWDGYHDIGWAHGPAGTARLFYRLWQITGEETWMNLVRACAEGIRQSGLPDAPNPGFGDAPFKPDLRFGTASVAMFFLDLHRETGDAAYLDEARALVDHLLGLATHDNRGLRWEAPRYVFFEHSGEPAAFTGYFYGAAGYGLLLLRLDGAKHGTTYKISLPDDPFIISHT